ncbi:MAG: hypothetical protein NVS1B4_10880 [Gemmatimonadaceae bacterium]
MECGTVSRRAGIIGLVAVLIVATAVGVVLIRRPAPLRTPSLASWRRPHAPAGVRIKVEVVNATRVRGLGRRVTRLLRGGGFDVVAYATGPELRDSTLVLDRSGHAEWAQLIADALGNARVETRPDSSRFVDATVILGTSWRAPPQPIDP